MTEVILTRYIHFISIMIVFAMVVAEFVLIQQKISRKMVKRLFVVDGIYGAFSLILVGAGLYLWLGGLDKPAAYYNQNIFIYLKIGLFLLVGILSLWPTRFYFKNRKGDPEELLEVPRYIKRVILLELVLLVIIPVLATLMSRGYGMLH
ncbi:MAG: DUF2214 family protein [Fulvivirga sp.]|nr:DUF2214 family protein [Fulvivirga sp.]